jgi:hypothetical protein
VTTTKTSDEDSPTARRERRERRRRIGVGLIVAGVVIGSLAVFAVTVLEYDVFAGGRLLPCGTAVNPTPGGDPLCAGALREPALVGTGLGILAAALIAGGFVIRALTPRPLSF